MKEYEKLFIKIVELKEDVLTLNNSGEGGEVGEGGDGNGFGDLFG